MDMMTQTIENMDINGKRRIPGDIFVHWNAGK